MVALFYALEFWWLCHCQTAYIIQSHRRWTKARANAILIELNSHYFCLWRSFFCPTCWNRNRFRHRWRWVQKMSPSCWSVAIEYDQCSGFNAISTLRFQYKILLHNCSHLWPTWCDRLKIYISISSSMGMSSIFSTILWISIQFISSNVTGYIFESLRISSDDNISTSKLGLSTVLSHVNKLNIIVEWCK